MTKRIKRLSKISDVFPVLLFVGCWGWLIALTYYTSGNILDADASNVLVLSNFLAKENAIMSTGWRYYTELHVINMQLVYSFFFRLFQSWRLVRFLGTVTLQAILVASYWFVCKQANVSRKAFFYSATFLLLPFSVAFARIVLLHGHYTFHISLGFLLIGLLIKLSDTRVQKKAIYYTSLTLFFVLCFLTGTNGMRQLYISLFPAFLIGIFQYIRSDALLQIAKAERTGKTPILRELYQRAIASKEGRALLLITLGVGVNLIGIATNLLFLRRLFGFSTYYSLKTIAPQPGALNELINDLLELFGYRDGARVFSLEGVCSLLAILAFALVAGVSVWQFFSRRKEGDLEKRFVASWFFSAMMFESLVFLITANYSIHYYTPVIVLVAFLVAVLIDAYPTHSIRLTRLFAGIIMFSSLVSAVVTTNFLVNKPEQYVTQYDGLSYTNINLVSQIRPAAEYLEEHDFTFGYAFYWDSGVVTELTDGKVEVCAVVELEKLTYSYANTKKAYWEPDYHQGKTFALFEKDDESWKKYPIFEGGIKVFSDDYFEIYEYPAPLPFEKSDIRE